MKAGLMAPLYLSVSWILTVSYQLLTDTAVKTISGNIALIWPSASIWLNTNIATIVFIYAFTWIFVLSDVIPAAIIGRERGILAQYAVVLALSLVAFFMPDILLIVAGIDVNQAVNAVGILQNPAVAVLYLSVPYLFMGVMDFHERTMTNRKKKEEEIKINNLTKNRTFNYKVDSEESLEESDKQSEKT